MHEASRVSDSEAPSCLIEPAQRFAQFQATHAPEPKFQIFTLQALHGDVRSTPVEPAIVDADYVRALQFGSRPRFTSKAFDVRRVRAQLRAEQLHGDARLEFDVL